MVDIRIRDDEDTVVQVSGDSKQAIEFDLLFAGHIVAQTLANLKAISIEAAAIEIMQAINLATNELSKEENEDE